MVCGAILLWAAGASAGGLYVQELATPRNGTSQAGQAAYAYDAATAVYNPAGMSRIEKPRWLVGVQPFITDIEFDLKHTTTFDGGDGGQQGGIVPALGAYYVHPLNDRWALGASLGGISGGALNPDNDWAGRFFITDLSLVVLAFNPVVSYRVNDWLSVGGGFAINYGTMDFELKLPRLGNFVDQRALRANVQRRIAQSPLPDLIDRVNQLPPPVRDRILRRINDALAPALAKLQRASQLLQPGPEGKVEMSDVYDFQFNFNAGILIEPCERWRFGITYRSEVDFDMQGDFSVKDTPPIFRALGLTDGDVEAEIVLPHMVRASVYHQLTDTVALMANVGWEQWSAMDFTPITGPAGSTIQIPRNWKDTWHFALGAEWRAAPRWLLQTGVAYDTSPVRDRYHNLPDQPSDRQWRFSAGVVYDWSERVKLGLAYTYIDFGRSPIDVSNPFGRLAGDYKDFVGHAIALSVGF
jgi:long-chain fatty acid transport protein